jgi:anti-sigma factor RsiW
MKCDDARVNAYFDGELDSGETASVQQHLRDCGACRALLADLEVTRATLRDAPRFRVPAHLRSRIDALLDTEPVIGATRPRPGGWRSPTFWWGAFAGAGASVAAAALVLFVFVRAASAPIVDELLSAHLRSLKSGHLVSVISGEQHTVKPWFSGRADVAPAVTDYRARGFALVGGRVEALAGARAAVMVYRHGAHVVNVFSWPREPLSLSHATTYRGYRLLFWQIDDVAYCAVSDVGWSELAVLEGLVRAQALSEQRAAPRQGINPR